MRRRILIALAVTVISGIVVSAGLAGYTWWRLATLNTFETMPPSASSGATTATPTPSVDPIVLPTGAKSFLVFSVGSEGIDPDDGTRLGIGGKRARMADGLADSIMVIIADPNSRRLGVISIPRDTWLADRGHRVNESYKRYGINGFMSDVSTLTGLRVDHAISANFAAFADLTDAVGGVDIELPTAVRDIKAKLELQAGCVHLDGPTALAFVRSRHWQVFTNGAWRADATSSDWGRIERQQAFLRLVLARIMTPELPLRIPALVDVAGDNLTIDANLTVTDMLGWAKAFAAGVDDIVASTLPGKGFTTDAGASVIGVDPAAARTTVERVLARIGLVVVPATDGSLIIDGATTTATVNPSTPPGGSFIDIPVVPGVVTPGTALSPIIESTPASPKASAPSTTRDATAKVKPWRPDTGDGSGGLRFTSCA